MSWGAWGPGLAAVVISPAHTWLGLWILWDQSLLIQSSQKFCKLSSFLLLFLNSRFECFLFYKAFSSVQFSHSVVSDSLWPHGLRAACQASLSITNSQRLLKLMSIELVNPSNHLILSSPSPPAFNLSQQQGLFKWIISSHQVAKVLEIQLQHQSF